MIGVAAGPGRDHRLLVLLADGRRVVTRELPEQEFGQLWTPVAERLRPPHSGARSLVRWLHPALPVDVELDAAVVHRIALPAAQD
ncbi:hypothetical protein CFP65_0411 [Kitasatospora sp. MMS16-BH015]|uniref:hypothetical protein n=1 Tax=Kitasatospora sp. MMS16-BH015 TaxID=2018025 RepID=UPI000CA239D6|nr:hypothetical protein [Kitasatospora sp. MMS16-BH015]AUG75377.1 hypothetical protein CFP65_0411 [Kitasatospora sp. MMS16-BH015]